MILVDAIGGVLVFGDRLAQVEPDLVLDNELRRRRQARHWVALGGNFAPARDADSLVQVQWECAPFAALRTFAKTPRPISPRPHARSTTAGQSENHMGLVLTSPDVAAARLSTRFTPSTLHSYLYV